MSRGPRRRPRRSVSVCARVGKQINAYCLPRGIPTSALLEVALNEALDAEGAPLVDTAALDERIARHAAREAEDIRAEKYAARVWRDERREAGRR